MKRPKPTDFINHIGVFEEVRYRQAVDEYCDQTTATLKHLKRQYEVREGMLPEGKRQLVDHWLHVDRHCVLVGLGMKLGEVDDEEFRQKDAGNSEEASGVGNVDADTPPGQIEKLQAEESEGG